MPEVKTVDSKVLEALEINFETTRYKNEHFNKVLMLPTDCFEGASVQSKGRKFYKLFIAEPDDKLAQGYIDQMKLSIEGYDSEIKNDGRGLEAIQKSLLLQAYDMHLLTKMKI